MISIKWSSIVAVIREASSPVSDPTTTPPPTTAPARRESKETGFDVDELRRDFPILSQHVHGKPLVYLDNAATTQKPTAVLDAERRMYEQFYANIHRGVHLLSVEATEAYETARRKIQNFIHAGDQREIIFVRGTTEAVNLVAQTYGRRHVGAGDEVVITAL